LPSNLYRNNTPCPQFLYYKEIKRPRKLPRLSECEKVFGKHVLFSKGKRKTKCKEREKRFQKGPGRSKRKLST